MGILLIKPRIFMYSIGADSSCMLWKMGKKLSSYFATLAGMLDPIWAPMNSL